MTKPVASESAELRLAKALKKVEIEVRKVEGDGLGHWAYFLSGEAFSIEHNHQREDPGAPLTLERLAGIRSFIDKSCAASSEVASEARVLVAECEERARKLPPHRNVATAIERRKLEQFERPYRVVHTGQVRGDENLVPRAVEPARTVVFHCALNLPRMPPMPTVVEIPPAPVLPDFESPEFIAEQLEARIKRIEEEERIRFRVQEQLKAEQQRADEDKPEAEREPQRRLRALRAMGGDFRKVKGEFQFTGIVQLAKSEKAAKRPRSSEKTIREDLKEAAEAEHREGRPGKAPSWYPT